MSQPLPLASTSSEGEGCSAPKRLRRDSDVPTRPLPMNLWRLIKMTDTDEKAIEFCQSHGLLPYYSLCPTCHRRLESYQKVIRKGRRPYYRFQCGRGPCRKAVTPNEVGLKRGTWFEGSQLRMQKSLVLAYCFAVNFSFEQTITQSSLEEHTSNETVFDYFNYCREVCAEVIFDGTEAKQIGGPNCNVEIDEVTFGKRKFNRGRLEEGQWVLGGICRETKDSFLVIVENRMETTLIGLIKRHVREGSVVHTDCFDSYDLLNEEGYTQRTDNHTTDNHSENCLDPEIGASTNLIESTWRAIRKGLPSTPEKSLAGHLAEYIWRRRNRGEGAFLALMKDISKVYPVPGQ